MPALPPRNRDMAMPDLSSFRRQIDAIDDRLLALLGERFQLVRQVAAWKASRGIPAVIPERIVEVRERCAAAAGGLGMEPEFVRRLYELLIDEACRVEEGFMNQAISAP